MTYAKEFPALAPLEPAEWEQNKHTGFRGRVIESKPDDPLRSHHFREVTFQDCDFQAHWVFSTFTGCTFEGVRFGGIFDACKFSRCEFVGCDFIKLTFDKCKFVNRCNFRDISASPEEIIVTGTRLDASAFVGSLRTNLNNLPNGVSPGYQEHRLIENKAKVAQILYASTREESDVEVFFDAYKALTLSSLRWKVQQSRYKDAPSGKTPSKRHGCLHFALAIPAGFEYAVVAFSGWLTRWGSSLWRPFLVFVALLLGFSGSYHSLGAGSAGEALASSWPRCLLRAFDVTVVAGYTAHPDLKETGWLRAVTALNLLLGLFWYSLIVPVLSRRLLR